MHAMNESSIFTCNLNILDIIIYRYYIICRDVDILLGFNSQEGLMVTSLFKGTSLF